MKVVIIGNGVAGNTVASTLRLLDAQADITIISAEKHSAYSACAFPRYVSGEISRRRLFLKTRKDYAGERIKTVFGQSVNKIDPEGKRVIFDTASLAYDKLVIATGSKPIVPPINGVNLEGVFTLKSLDDADRIRNDTGKTAVVIGSGPIGVETSIALTRRGVKVYLIEMLERIMPKVFDEKPASRLRGILEGRGIGVLTGETVTGIAGDGKVEGVATNRRQISCDMVILGVGMKPDVELARGAGLDTGRLGGISVNRQMRTSAGDIYAGGDCAETEDVITGNLCLGLLWHNARRQGEVIAHNCCGIQQRYPGSLNITSLDIFGNHAVSLGLTEAEAGGNDIEVIERCSGENYCRLILRAERLIGAQSIGDARNMGMWLQALMGKHDLKGIRQVTAKGAWLPLDSWYYRIARYN